MRADPSRRLALSRLLTGVDVHPTSVPPSAVLLVRRMCDPAPRTLDVGGAAVLAPPAWQRALQRAVDRAAREAVRPAAGPVPPSAEAVLFLDPAELLACLARDFLNGDVPHHWWWQAWLRASGRSPIDLVFQAWLKEARAIPAAIAALQQQDLAAPFVRALSSAQVMTLVVAVAEAYACPSLAAAARPDGVGPAAPVESTRAESEGRRRHDPQRAAGRTGGPAVPAAPWERRIPFVMIPASLPVEHRVFLGVTLSLWHAPLAVRTREYQRALQVWRRHVESHPSSLPDHSAPTAAAPERVDASKTVPPAIVIGDHRENSSPPAPVRPVEPPAASDVAGAHRELTDHVALRELDRRPENALQRIEGMAPRAPDGSETLGDPMHADEESSPRPRFVETPARHREHQPPALTRPNLQTPAAVSSSPDASSPPFKPSAWPRIPVDSVVTELGGVLFLVNVLDSLRFFERLDDHFRVASTIGGWGWLEIVARCLLGRRHAAAAGDPIWAALGQLDGRAPGVAIPQQVRIARNPELPEAWRRPARVPSLRMLPLAFDPVPDLRRLLAVVMPYLRWRLLHALDMPSGRDAPLASRLCYRRGRLEWTATHVDLHMEMSEIDIAVRLAGLDANPGWVPALGRVVTFHFD